MRKLLSIVVLSLVMQGCGFHLANYKTSPLNLCVSGEDSTSIAQQIHATCDKNSPHLIIKTRSFKQMDISASTNNNVKQYQLEQYLIFDLFNAKHKALQLNKKLSINKPLIINNNAILSSNIEREVLLKEMRHALAHKLAQYIHNSLN